MVGDRPCAQTSRRKTTKGSCFRLECDKTWSTRTLDDSHANSEVGAFFRPCGVIAERRQQGNMSRS